MNGIRKRARVGYSGKEAKEALESRLTDIRRQRFDRIFTEPLYTLSEIRDQYLKAGVEDFRLHDLRLHFASYLTMRGQNQRIVQELLGHKDPKMTMRYSHLSSEHLRTAVKSLETLTDVLAETHRT